MRGSRSAVPGGTKHEINVLIRGKSVDFVHGAFVPNPCHAALVLVLRVSITGEVRAEYLSATCTNIRGIRIDESLSQSKRTRIDYVTWTFLGIQTTRLPP